MIWIAMFLAGTIPYLVMMWWALGALEDRK